MALRGGGGRRVAFPIGCAEGCAGGLEEGRWRVAISRDGAQRRRWSEEPETAASAILASPAAVRAGTMPRHADIGGPKVRGAVSTTPCARGYRPRDRPDDQLIGMDP